MTATPEEKVRQQLIVKMLGLGYPKQLLSIEKDVRDFVQGSKRGVPYRRVDIVCFSKKTLQPLLIVECKSISLNQDVIHQVIGYNQYIQSAFIAVANQTQILTGWYDQAEGKYCFTEMLPSYEQLLKALV